MRKVWMVIWVVIIAIVWVGCKERFDPKIPSSQSNYLVVEGFINARGFTTIKLSRTVAIKDSSKVKPELNAIVTIKGEDNSTFNVRATGKGSYVSDSLILKPAQKYRLQIKTTTGEYLSEYVAVKQTPLIDSISWKYKNSDVEISVNTHDQQNNTRYYKWDYEETWEIHSAYMTYYEYKNGAVTPRQSFDEILKLFYCWRNESSQRIIIGSSAQLANDVISSAPLISIPMHAERFSVRYSILVRQYSLDRKGYDFFSMMKSNTESLGSIFDPLPSEVTGNISCVSNPNEKVIGYIPASTVNEKRIFISNVPSRFTLDCQPTYVANNRDSFRVYYDMGGLLPYQAEGTPGPIKGYYSAYPDCVDCTLRGTNVKPSFW
ncbi:DUF4249 domain-containing protein [Segetibacter aerophilus]|uniref:DUF4249 domain-containing protein n=1 Tax=Segetibacter aerophilus TaxID=670293 RepID=A0A512BDG2_9BACT|nr:DUF4249 domain-containing protein [Segetibacter aerophilus]GEO10003.1 hypothetical protein SAE01_24990 [Segetibacter aerophilus]